MMYYLWRALAVCVLFGTIQWMYTHPESQMSQTAIWMWGYIKTQWSWFVATLRSFVETGLNVKPAG